MKNIKKRSNPKKKRNIWGNLILSEQEILDHSNDQGLGEYIRIKYDKFKKNTNENDTKGE